MKRTPLIAVMTTFRQGWNFTFERAVPARVISPWFQRHTHSQTTSQILYEKWRSFWQSKPIGKTPMHKQNNDWPSYVSLNLQEPPPATTTASRPDSHITFRVKGIPKGYDRNKVKELVRAVLKVDEHTAVFVHSLAADPCHSDNFVATLSFQKVPDEISSYNWKGEWCVPVPEHLDYPSDQRLLFDTTFYGFTPLHTCDEKDCTMDLIAVTGLGGHAFGSFKQKDGSYMWLRDSLPNHLRGTRILIWGYDTELAGSSSFQNIQDLGNKFSDAIRTARAPRQNSESKLDRPLVLIGHSLGGIVVKEAIAQMPKADSMEQANLRSILGILFFGVPNQGLNISHLRAMVKGQPNQALLDQCNETSMFLYDCNRRFLEAFSSRDTKIFSFYETQESPTPRKQPDGRWIMSIDPKDRRTLVTPVSAFCNRGWEDIERHAHPINRTHSDLVKFKSPHDPVYLEVRHHLQQFSKNTAEFKRKRGLCNKTFTPEQQGCLQSLAFEEQEWREQEIHTARNTCHWLLRHEQYEAWLGQEQGLLWIRGHAASGKSTLMKYAWRMQERASAENGDVVAAFFFHGRGKPIQRTKLGLFRSLLNQILPRFPEVLQLFAEFHQQHIQERGQKWKWGENELRDFFADHLPEASKARPIIIFVDALDEAGRGADSEVARFFVRLISAAKRHGGKLKVCLSSRHYPGLILGPAQSISVDAENNEDIGTAVRDRLGDLDGSPKRRQELEHEIVSRAKGIFHWAIIVAEDVRHKWNARENFSVIQRSIEKTPDSLHSLYAEILDETKPEERPQTLKLLRWVCFAVRPLSTLELQHALALDSDMTYTKAKHYRKDDRFPESLEYMAEVIGKLSRGLVEVVEHNYTKQAQFIHQAVEDYLMESGLARLALDGKEERDRPLNSTAATAQVDGLFQISRSCIKYLKLKDIRKHVEHPPPPGESTSSVAAYLQARLPLAAYALSSLKPHLRDLEAEGIDQSDLLSLLSFPDDDGHILATWQTLAERLDLAASSTKTTQEASASTSVPALLEKDTRLLHLLAECGIASALRPALAVLPNDPERAMALLSATDALGRTPLALAAREGQASVVALLLDRLTRLQSSSSDDRTSSSGDGRVVPIVDPPATIDLPDVHGATPLTHAATEGHVEVVRLLLRFGAKVRDDGDDASSPLAVAMQNGHVEVVKILQEVSAGGLVEFTQQEGR